MNIGGWLERSLRLQDTHFTVAVSARLPSRGIDLPALLCSTARVARCAAVSATVLLGICAVLAAIRRRVTVGKQRFWLNSNHRGDCDEKVKREESCRLFHVVLSVRVDTLLKIRLVTLLIGRARVAACATSVAAEFASLRRRLAAIVRIWPRLRIRDATPARDRYCKDYKVDHDQSPHAGKHITSLLCCDSVKFGVTDFRYHRRSDT